MSSNSKNIGFGGSHLEIKKFNIAEMADQN
jgi:hypothetical protein